MIEANRNLAGTPLASKPPPQHHDSVVCPVTNILIPKTIEANLIWRQKVLDQADSDPVVQGELRAACKASISLWLNLFGWTFRQKIVLPDGNEVPVSGARAHVPFITWLVQDEFLVELNDAIDTGRDVLINKSRDMGATWLCLAVVHHRWQFNEGETFLELSRKEQLVDRRGNMDSLFEKHRYFLKWQPAWLRPRRIRDNKCHLENLDSGCSIEGESTNDHAGQGARKTAIFLDEFARVLNGEEIDLATADTSACRIFNSTPAGPGAWFTTIYRERRAQILTLPWWRHPEKSVGAHQVLDERGNPKWTSHWYEREKLRRSRKDVAQNMDLDHGQAGDIFFDADEIERHRLAHENPPLTLGELKWADDFGDDDKKKAVARRDASKVTLVTGKQNPGWRFYSPLVDGRPPQNTTYVMAADISNGAGDSNSVLTVCDHETGLIVAKYWDSRVSPEEFAEVAMRAGLFFGGRRSPAFLVWENNGPGGIFGRKVVKTGYQNYYCQRVDTSKDNLKTPRWGWHSSPQRKEILLARYREDLKSGRIINPCKESLDEALDYVYDDTGTLIPGKLKEDSSGARATHGDHVIADALLAVGRDELPRARQSDVKAPVGSFAHRRAVWKKNQRRNDDAEWRP